VLRGQNMETIKAFYDELAAVLQFPLYFGRNWDALDECLADLEWLPAEGYVLIFADSPSILKSADAKDIEGFLSLLSRSSNDWAEGSSLGGGLTRKPTPFHVVFQAGAAEADQFIHRVEAAIAGPVSKITLPETK
jgi:RNAse (barnase) inhibitor barstar